MALTINKMADQAAGGKWEIALERMFLTADRKRMVGEGDPAAASLYAAPGHRIPADMVKRFRLVGGKLPEKRATKTSDKRLKKTRNKKG